MKGRISEINKQIEALVQERKELERERFQEQVLRQPVVYRIRFEAEPTTRSFKTDFGCFSTRSNAEKYTSSFSTKLDYHAGRVTVEPIASETLSRDIMNSMDQPVSFHNYS